MYLIFADTELSYIMFEGDEEPRPTRSKRRLISQSVPQLSPVQQLQEPEIQIQEHELPRSDLEVGFYKSIYFYCHGEMPFCLGEIGCTHFSFYSSFKIL